MPQIDLVKYVNTDYEVVGQARNEDQQILIEYLRTGGEGANETES